MLVFIIQTTFSFVKTELSLLAKRLIAIDAKILHIILSILKPLHYVFNQKAK